MQGWIGNSSVVCERSVQEHNHSGMEAFIKSGGTCFHAFVSSPQWENGDMGRTRVFVVLDYGDCCLEFLVFLGREVAIPSCGASI